MIYDYITTKPPLDEDTLAHYGIKGMKWKNHIYAVKKALTNGYGQARNRVLTMLPQLQNGLNAGVSIARKKAKGSYYKGKSKAQEQIARYNRSKKGMMIGDVSSNRGTKLKRKSTVHISEVNGKSPQDIINLVNRKNKTYGGQANYLSGQRGSRRVRTTRVRKRR